SVTWSLTIHISCGDTDGVALSNTGAIATTQTTDPTPGNNSDTAMVTVVRRADLKVTKTAAAGPYIAGTDLTYTIKVENLGPSDNAGFTLTDSIPGSTSFVSATALDCVHAAGTVTCTSPGLVNGASVTWSLTIHISSGYTDGGSLSNTGAIATTQTTDPTSGNNSDTAMVTALPLPDPLPIKTAAAGPYIAGT